MPSADSNPRYQKSSGRRLKPQTTQPLGWANFASAGAENPCQVGSYATAYYGRPGFISRFGDRLFCGFIRPCGEMPTYYLDRFLSHPLQFIIHYCPNIRHYIAVA